MRCDVQRAADDKQLVESEAQLRGIERLLRLRQRGHGEEKKDGKDSPHGGAYDKRRIEAS